MADIFAAALLANFFEAGWSIQVLVGDMDRTQYFRSRLTRREIEKHLQTMVDSARRLPAQIRVQLPKVDWEAWVDLESELSCTTEAQRERVWTVIEKWLPPTGFHLRQYRAQRPELFAFRPA